MTVVRASDVGLRVVTDAGKGGTMKRVSASGLLALSIPERIALVEDLWDSIAAVPDAVLLTREQRKELDRRLEAYRKNPNAGAPWREVRKRIARDS